jgi:membrane protein required for colicin V production
MTTFDYAVFAIVGISIGLGWWRGFVYELLSLLGWVAAYFVARMFAPELTQYVPEFVASSVAKTAVAYACLFVVTLMVSGVVAWLLSKFVRFVGIGWVDRLLGGVFGLLRGASVVLIMVLLAGLTSLPSKPFWRDAWSSKSLQNVALFTKDFLPEIVAKKVTY